MLLLHFQSARVRGQYQDLFNDQDGAAAPGANQRRRRQRYRSRNCADRSRRLKAQRAKDRASGLSVAESPEEPASQLGYLQAGAESCAWPIPQQWLRTAFQECQRTENSVVRPTPIPSQASD